MLTLCKNKVKFLCLLNAYFLHDKNMVEACQKLVKSVINHGHCDTLAYVRTMCKVKFEAWWFHHEITRIASIETVLLRKICHSA